MKTMMRKSLLIFGLALGVVVFASSALASADLKISLPLGTSYKVGDTFTADLIVSPTESIYLTMIRLDYTPGLLEVESFDFFPEGSPFPPAGDAIDNSAGALIKSVIYSEGLTSQAKLGTVTFKVLKEGEATIGFGHGSTVFNNGNVNVVKELGSAQLTLATGEEQQLPVSGNQTATKESFLTSAIVFASAPKTLLIASVSLLIISLIFWVLEKRKEMQTA